LSRSDKVVNPLSEGISDIGEALESGAVDISFTNSEDADIILKQINLFQQNLNKCYLYFWGNRYEK
jgi:hypothetical protein